MTVAVDHGLTVLSAPEMREVLSWRAIIDALEGPYRRKLPDAPPRAVIPTAMGGALMVMPAIGASGAGVKVLGLRAANRAAGLPLIQGIFVLLDGATLAPRLILDGAELTRLRTAALSALATRFLAKESAHRLVVFGAGVQAEAHIAAIQAVRTLTDVTIVHRGGPAGRRLVGDLQRSGVNAVGGTADSIAGADIVCTCTTANTPVFDGHLLATGTHINAIGSYTPEARELDDTTMARAALVVADDRAAAVTKAGEFVIAHRTGGLRPDAPDGDLRDVVLSAVTRHSVDDITVYKAVGTGYQDLLVAETLATSLRREEDRATVGGSATLSG
jgi:ornithine cyclodeaminase/alanine dehydrogenase-like protein (mu-crystallin family)